LTVLGAKLAYNAFFVCLNKEFSTKKRILIGKYTNFVENGRNSKISYDFLTILRNIKKMRGIFVALSNFYFRIRNR